MILTKTPFRISFVGGGSDRPGLLPWKSRARAWLPRSIAMCMLRSIRSTTAAIRVAYSRTEDVQHLDDLQHELAREAMRLTGQKGTEIHSIADVPGGTGLGSSSAFTVGLLLALAQYGKNASLARDACTVELDMCHKPIGKQDQYTAAYGAVNLLGFSRDGVSVQPIACDLDALSAHCLLLDTGLARQGDAGAVLAAQQQDRDSVRALAELARGFALELANGDFEICGLIMGQAWHIKRDFIGAAYDAWYEKALDLGAWGGKLCGAGGGGFLLFLAPPERHDTIINALGLRHVPIRVGVPGSHVVYS
jgi:D-glycero-alpha-D-manno-heptose-7-phosphate kinase